MKEVLRMIIRSEGYNMTSDEISTHIVNLGIDNVVNDIRFNALYAALLEKELINPEHFKKLQKIIGKEFIEKCKENNIDTAKLEEILQGKLNIE